MTSEAFRHPVDDLRGDLRRWRERRVGEVDAGPELVGAHTCGGVGVVPAQARLPFGGAKGALRIDPNELSRTELQRVTRRYTSEIIDVIGPDRDIAAPDLGTDAQVMSWIMDTYSQQKGHAVPAVVTGKPPELGGSVARREATGRGLMSLLPAAAAAQADDELPQLAKPGAFEKLLAQPGEDDDPRRTAKMPPIVGHVAFEHVGFAYEPGEPVVDPMCGSGTIPLCSVTRS